MVKLQGTWVLKQLLCTGSCPLTKACARDSHMCHVADVQVRNSSTQYAAAREVRRKREASEEEGWKKFRCCGNHEDMRRRPDQHQDGVAGLGVQDAHQWMSIPSSSVVESVVGGR